MHGTFSSPSSFAASNRPWPAMRPFLPSSRIGLVNPNSWMLAAVWATCSSEWVREFRAYGTRLESGRHSHTATLGPEQSAPSSLRRRPRALLLATSLNT